MTAPQGSFARPPTYNIPSPRTQPACIRHDDARSEAWRGFHYGTEQYCCTTWEPPGWSHRYQPHKQSWTAITKFCQAPSRRISNRRKPANETKWQQSFSIQPTTAELVIEIFPPIWKLFLSPMWKFWCRMKEAKADYLKKDYLEDCGIMLKLQT